MVEPPLTCSLLVLSSARQRIDWGTGPWPQFLYFKYLFFNLLILALQWSAFILNDKISGIWQRNSQGTSLFLTKVT